MRKCGLSSSSAKKAEEEKSRNTSVSDHCSRVSEGETSVPIVRSGWAQAKPSAVNAATTLLMQKADFLFNYQFKGGECGCFYHSVSSFPPSWFNNHSRAIPVD